ncbi:MAG: polysaccharide biosynthesis C-terminal domain-containing protein [Candidatus Brocadiaceae bacterium]|nr:polysaccharide biosynthesis C-terminal domain-containing protein [Candidatus Brocadiaceae bacterium]
MIREFLKDIAKYLPAQVAPLVVGMISIPIVTRLFPPDTYGNYALVLSTVSLLRLFSTEWLRYSITRFLPVYESKSELTEFYSNILKLTLLCLTLLTFLSLCFLLSLRNYVSDEFYFLMRLGLFLFLVSSLSSIFSSILRAKRQVGWLSGLSIWNSVMSLCLGLLLVICLKSGIEGLIWGSIISIASVLPLAWVKALGGMFPRMTGLSFPVISEMARYGFPLASGNVAAWIISLSDRYIIELFRGSQEVGIYATNYNIAQCSIDFVVSLTLLASWPIEVRVWESGEEKSQEFLHKLTRYYLLFCIPAVVGVSVLSKPLISIFVSLEYYEGHKIIPFVAAGAFLLGLQHRFRSGLAYYKETTIIMNNMIVTGLVNVALNFVFVPKYGYMAAAITTFFSYFLLLGLMVFTSRRFLRWNFPFESLKRIIFASTIMGIITYYTGNYLTSFVPLNLGLSISFGCGLYFSLLYLLGEFHEEEIKALLSLSNRVRDSVSRTNRHGYE